MSPWAAWVVYLFAIKRTYLLLRAFFLWIFFLFKRKAVFLSMLRAAQVSRYESSVPFKVYLRVFYKYSQSILAEVIIKEYYLPYIQSYNTLYLKQLSFMDSYFLLLDRLYSYLKI